MKISENIKRLNIYTEWSTIKQLKRSSLPNKISNDLPNLPKILPKPPKMTSHFFGRSFWEVLGGNGNPETNSSQKNKSIRHLFDIFQQ